jgi:flagellar basal-body rod modification protein FlgD
MSVSATSSVTNSPDATNSTPSSLPVQTLGQSDFLKLLVTQMSSQDPMNPQSDTDFIAQVAQFSTLEATQSMQSSMSQIQSSQQLTQANGLLGKTVSVQDNQGLTVQGTVSSVQIQAGTPQLIINGQQYSLGQVLSVAPASSGGLNSTLN